VFDALLVVLQVPLMTIFHVVDVAQELVLIFIVCFCRVLNDLILDQTQDLSHDVRVEFVAIFFIAVLSPGDPVLGQQPDLLLVGFRVAVSVRQQRRQGLDG